MQTQALHSAQETHRHIEDLFQANGNKQTRKTHEIGKKAILATLAIPGGAALGALIGGGGIIVLTGLLVLKASFFFLIGISVGACLGFELTFAPIVAAASYIAFSVLPNVAIVGGAVGAIALPIKVIAD